MIKFIKSPLNYTGNKYRILPQITKKFPEHCGTFIDLFCGGATVGFNVNADKIILIDNNVYIINLLKFLASENIEALFSGIEKIINKYELSYSSKFGYKTYREKIANHDNNGLKEYNSKGFYLLRTDYNTLVNKNTKKANIMLYTLMVYAFNNDIRFNSNGNFNLPVGKTDFNKNNKNKLIEFNNRAKEINYEFICCDIFSEKIKKIMEKADFIYADPPYLITNAVYNTTSSWGIDKEKKLLNLLSEQLVNGKKIALSNVLHKQGEKNEILINWINDNKRISVIQIDYSYRSASYNKKNRDANEYEALMIGE